MARPKSTLDPAEIDPAEWEDVTLAQIAGRGGEVWAALDAAGIFTVKDLASRTVAELEEVPGLADDPWTIPALSGVLGLIGMELSS